MYSSWSKLVPGQISVCPVDLPGHGTRLREPLLRDVDAVVEKLALSTVPQIRQPFAFFGHSMGALVCFELARRLRSQYGMDPVHLFVSGNCAPHLPILDEKLSDLPEETLVQKVKAMNEADSGCLDYPELREVFLPILRADFAICETYQFRPEEPLRCPITALGGLSDSMVTRADLTAWKEHTTGAFSVRMFPGDHFYLNSSRAVLLEIMVRALNGYAAGTNASYP